MCVWQPCHVHVLVCGVCQGLCSAMVRSCPGNSRVNSLQLSGQQRTLSSPSSLPLWVSE